MIVFCVYSGNYLNNPLRPRIGNHCTWGDPKIPGIVKKNYLKYLYKFETLVHFEVLPLRLDAVILTPLPML